MVHKTIRKVLKKNATNKRTLIKNQNQKKNQVEFETKNKNQFGGEIEKQVGLYNQNKELQESAIEQSLRLSRAGLKLSYPGDIDVSKDNALLKKGSRKFGFTDFADNSSKKSSQLVPKFFYKNIYPTYLISHILDTPTKSETIGVGQSSNDNEADNEANNQA